MKNEEICISVNKEDFLLYEGKLRLDRFLAEKTGLTRSQIQLNIEASKIFVNEKLPKKTGLLLEVGDTITGNISLLPDTENQEIKAEEIPLEIIFEDEHLIVINKQKNLTVHPTSSSREGTLVNALLHRYRNNLSDFDRERPGIVHRLDKDTTGLMLVAKTNEAHLRLSEALAKREIKRIYWAIVSGSFKEEHGTIIGNIGRSPSDRKKMAVLPEEKKNSRRAVTHWKLMKELNKTSNKFSLLEIILETGRTHQIRVHFSHIGHYLLGDKLYCAKNNKTNLIDRQCLHAKELKFLHPVTKEQMHFSSELPDDFKIALEKLS